MNPEKKNNREKPIRKPKERAPETKKDESDDDTELQEGVRIQRPMGGEVIIEDVKPLTLIHKTGDKAQREQAPIIPKKNQPAAQSLLSLQTDNNLSSINEGKYQPITKESKMAYEEILNLVNLLIPDQPHSFIVDCAFEIISILKNPSLSETTKKSDIAKFVKSSEDVFYKFKLFSNEINDFSAKTNLMNSSSGDRILSLDLGNQLSSRKVEIEFETLNLDDEDEKGTAIESGNGTMEIETEHFDKSSLLAILQKSGKEVSQITQNESNFLEILGLENDIEIQNSLFQFDGIFDMSIINELYEKRHQLYYGFYLDTHKNTPELFNALIQKIKNSETLYSELKHLVQHYSNSNLVLEDSLTQTTFTHQSNSKTTINAFSLAQLSRLPKNLISLKPKQEEYISFSSTGLKLPKNSIRIVEKGYEEIRIPHALNSMPITEKLLKLDVMPSYFKEAFGDLKSFNRIQSKVFDFSFNSQKNLLLCAPTGAGKTIVALFAILGLLNAHRDPNTQLINFSNLKVVYLAPMKALVAEIVNTLNYRLGYLGIKAAEFTGDIHLTMEEFEDTTVIVSTPEKWDVLSRKSTERTFNDKLRLLIVDEIHLLGDSRGPVIEAVVLRTLSQKNTRVVGLSATLPNYEDVARFMEVDFEDGLFYFNNSFRPVPLSQTYIGVSETSGIKKMALVKEILFKKVLERIKDHQVLVFVHSRKETVKTANELKETAFAENVEEIFVNENSKSIIEGLKNSILSSDLQAVLSSGIGFHHAGLSRNDRKYVEDLFANGHLSVLISTATLAWGVNLPAHTVIIKNTQVYSPVHGKWVPLSTQNLLQMLGRAGRPLYDREGEGIIITSTQEMRHYMSFLNEQEPIESSLLSSLPEALNAEIVLGSVQNLKEATQWLTKTYLFQRLRRSPRTYGLSEKIDSRESQITTFVVDAVHSAACELEHLGLIRYHKEQGLLEATPEGRISSFFYVKPDNMKVYLAGLQADLNEIDLLKLFSSSIEFRNIAIREEEKIELNKLYSSVPIPVKGPVEDPKSKINVLLQCYLSRVELEGYALNCDMKFVSENAQRIFRALLELSIQKKSGSCQLILDFCKMTEKRVWKELTPLRQYVKLSDRVLQRIEQQEHLTFEHFRTMTVAQVNNIVKNDSAAEHIHSMIKRFPRLDTSVFVQILSRSCIRVSLSYSPVFEWNSDLHGHKLMFRILVFDVDQERLLYHQPFYVHKNECVRFKDEKMISFNLTISEPLQPHYFIKIVSDQWLSCDNSMPVSFKNVFLPTKFPLSREEPDDIPSNSVNEYLNEWGPKLGLSFLNAMQTQVFDSFYNSFDNVYLAAIKNSGKFKMSLIAITRLYSETKTAKSIVLFSTASDLNIKLNQLEGLAAVFEVSCAVLTGNLQTDIQIFTSAQIIVSTAKNFERLTRNYKKRPQLKHVRLVIATDLASMSEAVSSYEVVLTRVRLVFGLLNQKYRLIALTSPIANFSSICDWLGIEPENAFNFNTNMRNNDLNVLMNTVDAIQQGNFMEVAAKKLVAIIRLIETGLQSFVVLIDNVDCARIFSSLLLKELLLTEVELPNKGEHASILQQAQESFDDVFNANFLEYGLAYVYKGSSSQEITAVQKLLNMDILKILVTTKDTFSDLTEIAPLNLVLIDAGKFSLKLLNQASGVLNKITIEDSEEQLQQTKNIRLKNNLIVFLHDWEKEEFKDKFLEPRIIESQLGFNFIDVLNTEIVSGAISKKEESVDWLTWTYFYRRLTHNPNYYNLTSSDPLEINDYISELIDAGLADLQQSKCVEVDQSDIKADNNGVIASFYDLNVTTIFSIFSSIDENFTWRTLLHTISSASEMSEITLSPSEFRTFEGLNEKIPLKVPQNNLHSNYFKVFVALQGYLNRLTLPFETEAELQSLILPLAVNMLNGFIDCASSVLALKPALLAMKMSQMITQRIWYNDNTLKQLPFFNEEIIEKAKNLKVEKLEDFLYMEDQDRDLLLQGFSNWQKTEIARFANSFPSLQVDAKLVQQNNVVYQENEPIKIMVEITRENTDEELIPICNLGLLDKKDENWWVVVADREQNKLFYVKKIQVGSEFKKEFSVNAVLKGHFNLSVLLVSDSCAGFDAEISNLKVQVIEEQFEESN